MRTLFGLLALVLVAAARGAAPTPIAVKVVVVATYEVGADTGDKVGEFQSWVEREHLDQTMTVPGMEHVVRTNGQGLWGVVSGTTSRSGLQVEALALDPRFDFSHAYWILAGIACLFLITQAIFNRYERRRLVPQSM